MQVYSLESALFWCCDGDIKNSTLVRKSNNDPLGC